MSARSIGARLTANRAFGWACAATLSVGVGYGVSWAADIWTPPGVERLPELPKQVTEPPFRRNFRKRVWLHGANNRLRARYAARRYAGLEIDLVFDAEQGVFDVRHPPDPSVQLSLTALLASLPDLRTLSFWLDLKQLAVQDAAVAADAMRSLLDRFGVRSHSVVESTNAETLAAFSERGFYTSYGVNVKPLYGADAPTIGAWVTATTVALRKSAANAISARHEGYELLRTYWPQHDFLFWGTRSAALTSWLRELKLLADPRVKVVLREDGYDGDR